MNIYVLNDSFEPIYVIDSFVSFIWTDRYNHYGDFELQVEASTINFEKFKRNYMISIGESDRLMIIENIQLDSDVNTGDRLIINGRSLESILERRIVWGQITFASSKSIHDVFKTLLTDAFMTEGDRYVSNFSFKDNPELSETPKLNSDSESTYGAQFTGDGIYEVIINLCEENGLGFKIGYENDKMEFYLYKGIDHSYDNEDGNPFIVFSPNFDNILNSNYLESSKNLKTIALVAGEGEGSERKVVSIGSEETGLNRRELFVDARDLSSTSYDEDNNEINMTESEYAAILAQRGIEKLVECRSTISFEGQVEAKRGFVFGEDFLLGDIVEVVDKYGHENKCRVSEVVISYTTDSGYTMYPTFELIE